MCISKLSFNANINYNTLLGIIEFMEVKWLIVVGSHVRGGFEDIGLIVVFSGVGERCVPEDFISILVASS